ncbi:MAG: GNAT family N-acetyltransferase [Microbacteriaceae bacterium]|mgnify:CR=1 FL=1|nr:GNAT family N-acetyltransferase [Microbacteriaceae bacterium]
MSFRECLPSDPEATKLLNSYFTSRELGFVGSSGYKIVFPGDVQFIPPHGVFLVVETDAGPTGCGGIRAIESALPNERWFEVKHLWLEPGSRGLGLGGKLLDELERRAIEFGATDSVLDTNSSLEAAAGLYRSRGYEPTEPYNDNPNATNWYRKTLRS